MIYPTYDLGFCHKILADVTGRGPNASSHCNRGLFRFLCI